MSSLTGRDRKGKLRGWLGVRVERPRSVEGCGTWVRSACRDKGNTTGFGRVNNLSVESLLETSKWTFIVIPRSNVK